MIAESMKLDVGACGDVAILKVQGMLATRPNMSPFYRQLSQFKEAGHRQVVVDFSGVMGCGAAMLSWLVNGQQTLRAIGGDLVLSGLSKRMDRILKLTRLSSQFRVFKTADQAVTRLQKPVLCSAA